MSQYEFDKLVEKYLAGQCAPDEETLLRDWSESKLAQSRLHLDDDHKTLIQKRIWRRLDQKTLRQSLFSVQYKWLSVSVVAASVLLVLTGIYDGRRSPSSQAARVVAAKSVAFTNTVSIKNTTGKAQRVSLQDGSTIVLKAQSTISYPAHFGDKSRQVYLQGEAFFDVRKNPGRPFVVHTGSLVTQVLGTSFTVRSYDDARTIEVAVTRGRVSVYEASEKTARDHNGVILIPNQKITFDKASRKLVSSLVETPTVIQPVEARTSFVFDRAPLTRVLTTLSKAYGIEFIVENPVLNHCVFNGDLNDLPLYIQLDLLCKSINAHYERRGTTLFIHGEGCLN